jgi:hypothetical protein
MDLPLQSLSNIAMSIAKLARKHQTHATTVLQKIQFATNETIAIRHLAI